MNATTSMKPRAHHVRREAAVFTTPATWEEVAS